MTVGPAGVQHSTGMQGRGSRDWTSRSGAIEEEGLLGSSSTNLINRALRRAGEASLIEGNTVTLLRDGPAVFGSWLEDIAAAQRFVLIENYIFRNDRISNRIAEALIARVQAGVEVCLLYDWLGCLGTSRTLWLRLRHGGVKVRAFRPMRLVDPLTGLKRNHRKVLCIDGTIGHVGGLCVGDAWAGDPERGIPPWRDTAVRIAGPAAAELCMAFDETWSQAGPALPQRLLGPVLSDSSPAPSEEPQEPQESSSGRTPGGPLVPATIEESTACAGAPVRVVSGLPGRSRIFRLTQVLLANAAKSIWITDAYFLTPPTMYEALIAAARDGVDVRVLVPGRSDLPWIAWMGRAGYLGLLEAGVRMFEWEGPMLHAKTTVVDGRWCRIGSSNLNLASLLTNWELDVLIEDRGVGTAMERMFLADLASSRELEVRSRRLRGAIQRGPVPSSPDVLAAAQAREPTSQPDKAPRPGPPSVPVSDRAHAAVARAGAMVLGAALRRRLERTAWTISLVSALLLAGIGALGLRWPTEAGWVVAVLALWLALGAMARAVADYRTAHRSARRSRRKRSDGKSRDGTPLEGTHPQGKHVEPAPPHALPPPAPSPSLGDLAQPLAPTEKSRTDGDGSV